MAKKAIYFGKADACKALAQEIWESASVRKENEDFSVSLHYRNGEGRELLRMSQLTGAIADVAHGTGVFTVLVTENLQKSTKVILRRVSEIEFKKRYNLTEAKPTKAAKATEAEATEPTKATEATEPTKATEATEAEAMKKALASLLESVKAVNLSECTKESLKASFVHSLEIILNDCAK